MPAHTERQKKGMKIRLREQQKDKSVRNKERLKGIIHPEIKILS